MRVPFVRVTSHESPVTGLSRVGLLAFAFAVIALLPAPASAQPAPLMVEADQVTYDQSAQTVEATGNVRLRYRGINLRADHVLFELAKERLTARGHVVLIDAQGREMQGDALTYDIRLDLAEMQRSETIVDRVYVRSERLRVQRRLVTATEATATTCDPARPAYRITAGQIEIRPGDRLTARRASLWVGRFRVLTLPVLTVSLRTAEETARSLPRFGYNTTDGFWIDYTYGYDLGSFPSALYLKYGTKTGFIARNSLAYRRPPYSFDLTVGRNQDINMNVFDQAEVVLSRVETQVPRLPLFYSVSAGTGWFRESTTRVETSRTQYAVALRTSVVAISPQTNWQAAASWSDAWYGSGARQGVLRVNSSVTHQLSARETLGLSYALVEVSGGTPFAFDSVAVADRIHTAALQYVRTGDRGGAATALTLGAGYNFRDRTPSVILGYGERVPDRYHWSLLGEYNLGTTDTKLTVDAGLRLGYGTYFTVQGIYHTLTGTFEDLDYTIASRLCDCFDVSLLYRQVRQEIWFQISLTAFPQSRLQFQLPGP